MNPILVVDDDESYRELLVLTLEDHCEATQVHGFSAAAPLLRHLAGGAEPPCLVLLDLHLPEVHGVDLIDQIRVLQPAVPIAFLSGAAAAEARDACLAAGAFAFLCKPVSYSDLIRLLQDLLRSLPRA
ncbi:response regulator [Ramlibacter sp. AN1133]|uniref:response regulator n=1 Tax=Ramlibacter sp. AN1133 TaxID=3133429 RepID=UPI0030BBB393